MKILKKGIGKVRIVDCWGCGSKLEVLDEDVILKRNTTLGYRITIHCPVCDEDREIESTSIREKTIYEDEEDT